MSNLEDKNGITVQRRTAEYRPPKSWRTWLIGRPLPTADAPNQTMRKIIALAIFASDAMSSSAYSVQEVLVILAVAGTAAFGLTIPITLATVALLAILTLSYEQTIHAYPNGGGAYIVSRDNLGDIPAMVAAAALLIDYTLTVAVSISSGVAQIVSAFPATHNWKIWIAVALVALITTVNLRGVKEAGITFAIPTYYFVVMMFVMVAFGMVRYVVGGLGSVVDPPPMELTHAAQGITVLLILRAFSSGTTALTGVEAISNGITAFEEPKSKNAGITLIWMAFIMAALLLGISFLSAHIQAIPSEFETVISQLARTVFGTRGIPYLGVISATTIILIMAANTSFAGFPRLSALTAADGFLPRQLTYRGSRLVYSRGIVTLALVASLLIIIFDASVTRLIPLYAIGVFLSFTLSQLGMARRWWKIGHLKQGEAIKERGSTLRYESGWQTKMVINSVGTLATAVVTVVFAVTKFADGAWLVLITIPVLVLIFNGIHRHYRALAGRLSLEHFGPPPRIVRNRVILPIGGVHRGSLAALRFARNLSDDITAVHVSIEPEEAARIQEKWEVWGEGVRLVILDSQYRLFLEPLLEYIEEIDVQRRPNEIITVVVPQFIPSRWFNNALHTRTANGLRSALFFKKDIVITEVPYQVD